MEKEMALMAQTFSATARHGGGCEISNTFWNQLPTTSSRFSEFDRIFLAVRALYRQLNTLHAFTTTIAGGKPLDRIPVSRCCPRSHAVEIEATGLWVSPATTVVAKLRSEWCGTWPYDAWMRAHAGYNTVHAVMQNVLLHIPGASMDGYFGDYVIIHFITRGRTPLHALVAVSFIDKCLSILKRCLRRPDASNAHIPSVHFGLSTALSRCGFLGPAGMKTFMVISHGEAQASFLCRAATTSGLHSLLAWKTVGLVQQQMDITGCPDNAMKQTNQYNNDTEPNQDIVDTMPYDAKVMFEFAPAMRVMLRGEVQMNVSDAYTLVRK
ncbi:unnamed protein product [Bodo saltans]|uniref:Uncharacterized protein n=1 Tax=Bodo saltans TaxID=75058 RepID=A0A0S4J3K8_BODSA|nr:unnamed protein product [Bodo saltans]|eukprot:CUG75098.1 unnamed protein product [Bodo saltans]